MDLFLHVVVYRTHLFYLSRTILMFYYFVSYLLYLPFSEKCLCTYHIHMSLSIDFTFFRSPKISNNPHHSIDFNDEYDEYNPFCKTHIIGSAIKKDDTSNEALNIENDLTLFLVNDDLENP